MSDQFVESTVGFGSGNALAWTTTSPPCFARGDGAALLHCCGELNGSEGQGDG